MQTRTWSFWCHGPIADSPDVLAEQYGMGRGYKNALIAIEIQRRQKREAVQVSEPEVALFGAQIADIDCKLEALRDSASMENANARSTKIAPAIKTQMVELRRSRKPLYAMLKAARKKAREKNAEALKQIQEDAYAAEKLAYNESQSFWASKLLIKKEVEQSAKTIDGPRFRKWDGQGRVGVQFQNGVAVAHLLTGNDTRMRIVKGDASIPHTGKRPFDSVQIRVGSDDGRNPVWAKFPCILHREFPSDAVAKWAWIARKRVGAGYKYELCLVVQSASFEAPVDKRPERLVALDVGWRRSQGNELRYAYAYDGQQSLEMTLPDGVRGQFLKANELRSLRDRLFNEQRDVLMGWIAQASPESQLAAQELFPALGMWRSAQKLHRAVGRWGKARMPDDGVVFEALSEWARRENHLYRWETGARQSSLNHRKDFYRKAARDLAQRYTVIAIEDFDLRKVARRKNVEERQEELHQQARSQRFQTAISEFRQILTHQCVKFGTKLMLIAAENTTLTCHRCLHTEKWDKQPLHHTCSSCGVRWDQDENAAINIYGRALVERSSGADEKPSPVRKDKVPNKKREIQSSVEGSVQAISQLPT